MKPAAFETPTIGLMGILKTPVSKTPPNQCQPYAEYILANSLRNVENVRDLDASK